MTLQRVSTLPRLPVRPSDGHKGTFGRVLIVGGSPGMSGAAALSGTAALRSGAGLVTVACPASIVAEVSGFEPSYLTLPLPEDRRGRLHAGSWETLRDPLSKMNAAAIGPGLGEGGAARQLARRLYRDLVIPLVVDADGLNAFAEFPAALAETPPAARILTPHPGEFGRLMGCSISEVQKNREAFAIEFAGRHGVILVLKGEGTIVTDGTRLAVNTTGNSGMATGGTGDVLTGLISGLLAQQLPPFEAAQLGVHLHGLAGDLAAEELSAPGMIASDMLRFIPAAWLRLQRRGAGHQG